MKRVRIAAGLWIVVGILGATYFAKAEEITLKDGQKIVGTIIGYEKDMFRIETDYGIALVRKDKVASIQVSPANEAKLHPEAQKPTVAKTPAEDPASAHNSAAFTPDPPKSTPSASNQQPSLSPVAVIPQTSPAAPKPSPPVAPILTKFAPAPPAASPNIPVPPPPPPESRPLEVTIPAHLEDHVDGNTYFSDTFHFSMYKPPDWKIIEGVPKETGSGVMAMGTDDESTLMIVDRQVWSGAPKLTSDLIESRLRQMYQDYRRLSEDVFACDGEPAVRRTFTGVLDGAEWYGVAVHVIHGNTVFGIIGLTSAETYQFQEAIFNKIIRTFHFLAPADPGSAASAANPGT